jgi:phosphonate metabolism protein (transferase hexapeptide repeat family)
MSKLGLQPLIHPTAIVQAATLGRYTEIGERTRFVESTLGDYSYVVNDVDVIYARVGKFCSIAAHVRINPGNHPTWRASQSHFTYRASQYFDDLEDEAEFFDWRRAHVVTVGHDPWIGHGAVILPGRSVGTGAVVAGAAVVSRDVPAYTIAAGVPARTVRRRFAESIAERLLALAWWDWSHERLRDAIEDFRQLPVEAFLEKHEAAGE